MIMTTFRRLIALSILLCLTLCCLVGCNLSDTPGQQANSTGSDDGSSPWIPQVSQSSQSESSQSPEFSAPEGGSNQNSSLGESYEALAGELIEKDLLCAVAYIGYIEGPMGDGFNGFFEEQGYLDFYPFLTEIPYDRIVETDGYEMYCFVPSVLDAKVTVYDLIFDFDNEIYGDKGDVLYSSDSGEPFFTICNYSDVFSNLLVEITYPDGTIFSYSPSLSMENGKLLLVDRMIDFSLYPYIPDSPEFGEPLTEEDLIGDWMTTIPMPMTGEDIVLCLSFWLDEEGANRMEYWYGYPNSDIIEHFAGTYYAAVGVGGDEYDGSIQFDMMLCGGIVLEENDEIEPYPFTGRFLITLSYQTEGIDVLHMDGNALIFDTDNTTITFDRTYG